VLRVSVSIGGETTAILITEAIRSAARGVIRRARRGQDQSDGSAEILTELIDRALGDEEQDGTASS
jgi:hypothetical protein